MFISLHCTYFTPHTKLNVEYDIVIVMPAHTLSHTLSHLSDPTPRMPVTAHGYRHRRSNPICSPLTSRGARLKCSVSYGVGCQVSGAKCQVPSVTVLRCYGVTVVRCCGVLRCHVPALTAKHVLSQVYILEYHALRKPCISTQLR